MMMKVKTYFTFLNLTENQKGNEHEMDSISTLIKNLVDRVKEKKNRISSVLIIDDLDRLDPEHTFRLINIFSAHFDKIDNSNKFGFDKVIFVCDFENIRKMFHHKYGLEVDFSGYSDKFFSMVPYQFDNRQFIKEKTREIIFKIKSGQNLIWFTDNNTRFLDSTIAIIQSLIDTKQLNLRMLLSYPKLIIPNIPFGKKRLFVQNTIECPIVVLFYLLKNFYGSFDILYSKLKYLYERLGPSHLTSSSNNMGFIEGETIKKTLISYCLPFLLPEEIALKDIGTELNTAYSKQYDCTIHFNGFPSTTSFKNFQKATIGNSKDSEEIYLNPYEVLLDVFNTCQKLGAFK